VFPFAVVSLALWVGITIVIVIVALFAAARRGR
jgi:hypothetical protein